MVVNGLTFKIIKTNKMLVTILLLVQNKIKNKTNKL